MRVRPISRHCALRGVSVAALAVTVIGLPVSAANAANVTHTPANTYYVDAEKGSDANTGTSPSAAWRTLDKVNSTVLRPGDTVKFAHGETFHGRLAPQGSGKAGAPIRFTSYGKGTEPLIAGGGATPEAVLIDNEHDIRIDNLAISNTAHGIGVPSTTPYMGVHVTAHDIGEVSNIALDSLDIHDVDGQAAQADQKGAGVMVDITGNTTPTWYNNVTISNNEIDNVNNYGIETMSSWSGRSSDGTLTYPSTNVKIIGNYVHDITAGGINPHEEDYALVEGNTVLRAATRMVTTSYGNAGIWTGHNDHLQVKYNVVGETGYDRKVPHDDMAFDADIDARWTVFEYNYSFDNNGGVYMNMGYGSQNDIFRYNVSQGDHNTLFSIWDGADHPQIYNNTVHMADDATEVFDSTSNSPTLIANNIFDSATNSAIYKAQYPAQMNYTHNLYSGTASPTVPAQESAPVVGAADFSRPAPSIRPVDGPLTINQIKALVSGYKTLPHSPARQAGTPVAGTAATDMFGAAIPATPDAGFAQHRTGQL